MGQYSSRHFGWRSDCWVCLLGFGWLHSHISKVSRGKSHDVTKILIFVCFFPAFQIMWEQLELHRLSEEVQKGNLSMQDAAAQMRALRVDAGKSQC